MLMSPVVMAVGAEVDAPKFLLATCATLAEYVPKDKSALAKVPPTLLLMTMSVWSKLRKL
jgi:hypothetical protein